MRSIRRPPIFWGGVNVKRSPCTTIYTVHNSCVTDSSFIWHFRTKTTVTRHFAAGSNY